MRALRQEVPGQHVETTREGNTVPKYLWEASYTVEGAKGLLKDGGSGRRAAVITMVNGLGGKLESFYFAFGETDAYLVADLPNDEAAAAVSLTVSAGGGATVKTVKLLTVEQMDDVAKKSVQYRPPGA